MFEIFGPPRIRLTDLAALSRRLSVQLAAGVDLRRIWQHEVEAARGVTRSRYADIQETIASGNNLTEALEATKHFFPPLFRELVDVGEQSGHLAEVLRSLAENYEHQITLRRRFRSEMAYPMLQLTGALLVVGIIIWAMGVIGQMTGTTPDILQLGLVGTRGLIIYVSFLAAVGLGGYVLWQKIRRGVLWTRPLQRLIMRVPALSGALNTLALSRLTWSLSVTLSAGMELRKALELSLRSTHTARFVEQIDPIWRSIRGGRELNEAMSETGVFPRRIVDAIAVGERSGRLSETMELLSEQYQDEARAALTVLTRLAGVGVWLLVSGLIIFLIFRIFSQYLGVLNNAVNGR
ncbi:MAG TPA: type II secretion system F family protein [Pirellulales bacterium]|jgi:type II secretory pathway component PulF|nr:type II secretion system F family protein [Pirellulales bacterium]